jgi:hypothetical protein
MSTATLQKCSCCQAVDLDPLKAFFDVDLEALVCPDCRTQLRWAQARLKAAGLRTCTKAKGK